MMDGRHPQELLVPPKMAIAHQLIGAFAESEPAL
jgi:hypothetical protein